MNDTPIESNYLPTDEDSLWAIAELALVISCGEIAFDSRWVDYQESEVPGHECMLSVLLRYTALSGEDGRENKRASLLLGVARLLAEIIRLDRAALKDYSKSDGMFRRLAAGDDFSVKTGQALERVYGPPDDERASRAAGMFRQLHAASTAESNPLVSATEIDDLLHAAHVCDVRAAALSKPIPLESYPAELRASMAAAEAERPSKRADFMFRAERLRRTAERLQLLT